MEQHDKTFYQVINVLGMLVGGLGMLAFTTGYFLGPEARAEALATDVVTFASGRALYGLLGAAIVTLLLYVLNRTLNQVFQWRMPLEQINGRAYWQFAVLAGVALLYVLVFIALPRMALQNQ